ncbi:hypothetical protein SISSUDRAFT_1123579 [Sistotremastrum suecicum HHB10207 ss-3]|uniref:WW domain-containing protein n=1 Tax=Sistotremastrum suecicum HHB10207 ss-3 TaxID=1314776 RepID=A0A165XDP5_9AGAM|nr:hypothetical protein SISSUDRAFT_1123579 [Sistotremastrum suecicum HHB10207 ss-3]
MPQAPSFLGRHLRRAEAVSPQRSAIHRDSHCDSPANQPPPSISEDDFQRERLLKHLIPITPSEILDRRPSSQQSTTNSRILKSLAKTGSLFSRGASDSRDDSEVVDGWQKFIHPEGYAYFYHREERIVTENNMFDARVRKILTDLGKLVLDAVKPQAAEKALNIDLYLALDPTDLEICRYYMVDHTYKTVFWDLDEVIPGLVWTPLPRFKINSSITPVQSFEPEHELNKIEPQLSKQLSGSTRMQLTTPKSPKPTIASPQKILSLDAKALYQLYMRRLPIPPREIDRGGTRTTDPIPWN